MLILFNKVKIVLKLRLPILKACQNKQNQKQNTTIKCLGLSFTPISFSFWCPASNIFSSWFYIIYALCLLTKGKVFAKLK